MRAKLLPTGLCLVLLVVAAGCGRNKSYYPEWIAGNAASVEALSKLAAQKNWQLLAVERGTIVKIDLGKQQVEHIYRPKNMMQQASYLSHGHVALVEKVSKDGAYLGHFLVLVDTSEWKEVVRAPVEDRPDHWSGPSSILLAEDHAVLPIGRRLARYDFKTKRTEILLDEREFFVLKVVRQVSDLLYVVREGGNEYFHGWELVILKAVPPYSVVSTEAGVRNVLPVGNGLLIEKKWKVYEEDAAGKRRFLVGGQLLAKAGESAFLYTDAAYLGTGSVLVYDRSEGKSKELASDVRHEDIMSRDLRPFASPDAQYAFVCVPAPAPGFPYLYEWVYKVYELKSGRQVGAFYNPYLGKNEHQISQVLGWVE